MRYKAIYAVSTTACALVASALYIVMGDYVATARLKKSRDQHVSHEVFNFHSVGEEVTKDHVFEIVNTRTNPIEIKEVRTSCGCIATDHTKGAIPPRSSGFIHVTLNTHTLKGPLTLRRDVIVKLSPPEELKVFTVVASVEPPFEVQPSKIYFGGRNTKKADSNDDRAETVTIRRGVIDDPEWSTLQVGTDDARISIELQMASATSKQYAVRLKDTSFIQPLTPLLVRYTRGKRSSTTSIPLGLETREPFVITPSRYVAFLYDDPASTLQRRTYTLFTIVRSPLNQDAFELVDIAISDPLLAGILSHQLLPQEKGMNFAIWCKAVPESAERIISGHIELTFGNLSLRSSAQMQTYSFPVSILIGTRE